MWRVRGWWRQIFPLSLSLTSPPFRFFFISCSSTFPRSPHSSLLSTPTSNKHSHSHRRHQHRTHGNYTHIAMSYYSNNRNTSMGRAPNPAHNRQLPNNTRANGTNGIYCYGCQQTKPRLAFSETQIKKAASSTPKKTHQPMCKNCKSMHTPHSYLTSFSGPDISLFFQDQERLKFQHQLNKDLGR